MPFRSISYVPVTEHVMTDDWIAFGAAVWMKVKIISCTKGLGNCDSHGCRGPKGQLWCCKDGKIYVQSLLCTSLFLHARNRAHCSRPCGPTQCGASGANLFAAHFNIGAGPFGPATRRIQPRSHDAGLSHGVDSQD